MSLDRMFLDLALVGWNRRPSTFGDGSQPDRRVEKCERGGPRYKRSMGYGRHEECKPGGRDVPGWEAAMIQEIDEQQGGTP